MASEAIASLEKWSKALNILHLFADLLLLFSLRYFIDYIKFLYSWFGTGVKHKENRWTDELRNKFR